MHLSTPIMPSKAALLAVGAFATTAFAQSASVTITASHGGAGNGLTNTTITVPLGSLYTNAALDEVSYLYLTGASDAVLESITCTPHRYANGTGEAGRPFTSNSPSLLSTNTVKVGSLTCVASDSDSDADATSGTSSNTAISTSPSSVAASSTTASNSTNNPSMTTSSATSSSTEDEDTAAAAAATPMTSTFLTTISGTSSEDGQTSAPQQHQSTVTSVMSASGSTTVTSSVDGAAAETATSETSSTSSAPASLSTENAAPRLTFGEAVWSGLAVGALGLAIVV
ncbi:hypothetical protein D0862_11611 [Hortaea werneckii]|uniref:Ig-like domain-containing protein n=1 Tax=Hortaea werneckii TaxID=91943 RepID=A0A3M7F5F4_HORWE|nr:hypothetical protein D0862_11611 [Hortaea werneckii]